MDNIGGPTVNIKKATYENVYFDCPHCQKENILNRATDIPSNLPILGGEYNCLLKGCGKPIWLNTDRVQCANFEWLLQELDNLKSKKLYRDYALTLCQAVEAFYLQALVNQKLDRNPLLRDRDGRIDTKQYNFFRKELEEAWKVGGFENLRKLFNECYKPHSKAFLPINRQYLDFLEDKRKESFKELKTTKINSIRNAVVHSSVYRPSLVEIEPYDALIDAVSWLGVYLDVKYSDEILNSYAGGEAC